MVLAILEGRKTMTRRAVNEKWKPIVEAVMNTNGKWGFEILEGSLTTPYGQPSDRLWVRESWKVVKEHDKTPPRNIPSCFSVEYPATDIPWLDGKIRQSIFMPRWASRITLKITGIRVERLNDISEEDAIAEGVGHGFQMNAGWPDYQHIKNGVCELTQDTASMSFASLWESINGPDSWDANPWVWVIEFKRIPQ